MICDDKICKLTREAYEELRNFVFWIAEKHPEQFKELKNEYGK